MIPFRDFSCSSWPSCRRSSFMSFVPVVVNLRSCLPGFLISHRPMPAFVNSCDSVVRKCPLRKLKSAGKQPSTTAPTAVERRAVVQKVISSEYHSSLNPAHQMPIFPVFSLRHCYRVGRHFHHKKISVRPARHENALAESHMSINPDTQNIENLGNSAETLRPIFRSLHSKFLAPQSVFHPCPSVATPTANVHAHNLAPRDPHGTIVEQCSRKNPVFYGLLAKTLFHRFRTFIFVRPIATYGSSHTPSPLIPCLLPTAHCPC